MSLRDFIEPIDIAKARTQFSKLVQLAEQGQDVLIARAGKPVARLTQVDPKRRLIRFGLLKDKIHVSDDFDTYLPEDFLITRE